MDANAQRAFILDIVRQLRDYSFKTGSYIPSVWVSVIDGAATATAAASGGLIDFTVVDEVNFAMNDWKPRYDVTPYVMDEAGNVTYVPA